MSLASAAAVILHPHPSMGGDSSHPFVQEVATRLAARGVATATPDLSDPDPDAATPALEAVAASLNAEHVFLVGYSWGSVVVSHAQPHALAARILVAPPASMTLGNVASDIPALVLLPERDQYGDAEVTRAGLDQQSRVTMEVVPGADHFLWGAIAPIAQRCVEWLTSL